MTHYLTYFGFAKEPFADDPPLKEILLTDAVAGVADRFEYTLRLGGIGLVTGEIGSGKSTAIRYACGKLHASQYRVFAVTACSGSIPELYRQITAAMLIQRSGISKAVLSALIKKEVWELARSKKITSVLIIDEASLMRLEVFAELHTLCQFDRHNLALLPIILAGQSSLVDKLMYRSSAPLASRIVTGTHLKGLDLEGMQSYLAHHLKLAGVQTNPFEDAAITAIQQASGGLLRKANHLARGALIACAAGQDTVVNVEHVRIAATEIF